MSPAPQPSPRAWHRGRGSDRDPGNRFESQHHVPGPDLDTPEPAPHTRVIEDRARSLLVRNRSPDIPFAVGLNPYRGCEHGCSYCYARPYHEYLGYSPGLDFESKILVKREAAALLRAELGDPRWTPEVIGMSGVTDCYQPLERDLQITRACLAVLAEFRQAVGIITKNRLVTRDRDYLVELAQHRAVAVTLSITTLRPELGRALEPRASSPEARLAAIRELAAAGIPVGVNVAPVIPGLTDHEMPAILAAAAAAGARHTGYTVCRLPHGVAELFAAWLEEHAPGERAKVLKRIAEIHGGDIQDQRFGRRMRGVGIFADHIEQQFRLHRRRAGIPEHGPELSTAAFRSPHGQQLSLF